MQINNLRQQRQDFAMEMIREGMSHRALARQLRMSRMTIRRIWQERAVFNRPTGRKA